MPPTGFPDWLWAVLGVILPLIYQTFVGKLPGFVKFLVSWGISAVLVIAVGLIFLHYTPGQIVVNFAWLVACMQAVYSLMVKPVAKVLAVRR